MGAKIQQSVAYLLTEDEFWVGPESVQNTGPGCKPELGKTLSTAIHPSCVCASAGLIFLRRLSRPFLRAVQNTGDMDDVAGMDINHKVRQRRKHQLARAVHFSRAAYAGKLPQLCRGIVDSANHAGGVLG